MSAYIDATYIANAIGSDESIAMAGTTATTQLIQAASAMVDAALFKSGYAVPVTASDLVKVATLGAFLPMLYGRKGIDMPERFAVHVDAYVRLRNGEMPLPDLTPLARDAVGGNKFTISDPDSTDTTARDQVFRNFRTVF